MLGLFLSSLFPGSLSAQDCFQSHLEEAIAINKQRAPIYESQSQGESKKISRILIWGEKMASFFVAPGMDRKARPYQEQGINIVCDEFVSMEDLPPFRVRGEAPYPQLSSFVQADARKLKSLLRDSVKKMQWEELNRDLNVELLKLAKEPRLNCMLRHVLESMRRISQLAPRHIARAQELGLKSPQSISKELLKQHLRTLKLSVILDRWAAPLQADGLPIICQDVPPIGLAD